MGGSDVLQDRDEEDEVIDEITGVSCLSNCAPSPLTAVAPAWAPGVLDLNDYLPRTRDSELRMSVISSGTEAGWSDLFLLPQAHPDWLTSRTFACKGHDRRNDGASGSRSKPSLSIEAHHAPLNTDALSLSSAVSPCDHFTLLMKKPMPVRLLQRP